MKNKITFVLVVLLAGLVILFSSSFLGKDGLLKGRDLASNVTTATASSCTTAGGNTVITQFGITWTLSGVKPCGQFANGDWWVVGPVTVTNITPKDTNPDDTVCKKKVGDTCIETASLDMHGTMINPTIGKQQGWDSRMKFASASDTGGYDPTLNVARKLPNLVIPNSSSVVSAISYGAYPAADNPQLETIAVLTILQEAPPVGSFRPPLVGTDKTVSFKESQLLYARLASLEPVIGTPDLETVAGYFERPWIETDVQWTGRYKHPGRNYPFQNRGTVGTYGREIAHTAADGLLSLQLNYTNNQKRDLLVRMVQAGIDVYGAAKAGAYWGDGGGHNHGRKMVMLLAGRVLDNKEILNYADATKNMRFQEDLQSFYVTAPDTVRADGSIYFNNNTTRRGVLCTNTDSPQYGNYTAHNCSTPLLPYTAADVTAWKSKGFPGIPEWGFVHRDQPYADNSDWGTIYREVVSPSALGHVLTAHIMGVKDLWNHNATFDYWDRWYSISGGNVSTGTNSVQPFVSNMWKAYRNGGTDVPPSTSSTLTVTKSGSGTVTSSLAGINCGTDCSETYAADSSPSVTLTATPSTGYTFSSWTGCTPSTTNPNVCSITMTASKSVTASFQNSINPPPPPTSLVSPDISSPANNTVFPADTTSVRIEWEDMESNYLVRHQKLGESEVQKNTYTLEHYTIENVKPGERYTFWIHTGVLVAGQWSEPKSEITFSIADDTGRACREWE